MAVINPVCVANRKKAENKKSHYCCCFTFFSNQFVASCSLLPDEVALKGK